MKPELNINSDILIWAIDRAGSNIDEIAEKFPSFIKWLSGEKKPTFNQLKDFAQKLHLPFGYLFLKQPPEEKLPIPFFRTISSDQNKVSLNVYDAILILQQRQKWLTDYLEDNDYESLEFVGKYKNENNIQQIVESIRKILNLPENWASALPNWEKAKELLTQKIEEAGIIVTFSSIVGNNTHRSIKVEECRGFVLVDEYAPFMFINSADSKAAQIFTLAHELAHIWIGQSAGFDFRQLQPADNQIEKLCDKIAAEFLVPENLLANALEDEQDIENIARKFKVSQIVIARRLLDIGRLNRQQFFEFYDSYIKRDIKREEDKEDGGDFYKTQRKRLSVRFLSFINQAVAENKLLIRDAYLLTSLKGNTYHKFMKEHLY